MFCLSLLSLVVIAQTIPEIFDGELLGNSPISLKSVYSISPKIDRMYGSGSSMKPGSMNNIDRAVFEKNRFSYCATMLTDRNPCLKGKVQRG